MRTVAVKTEQYLCPGGRPLQRGPHQPNRSIPPHIPPTRQPIHHGGHPPRREQHLCQANEEQDRGRDGESVPEVINQMQAAGLGIKKQVLNNKCSAAMKECIKHNNIEYGLVPPGQHRGNQAEQAIQTFKAHFISILAGVNDKFPLSLWCHLLEPTELTLYLLHQSRVAPNISAFAHVLGMHNYMCKPFAPIGCAIQMHVKPDKRRLWDTRSAPSFNLGTSMERHHYF